MVSIIALGDPGLATSASITAPGFGEHAHHHPHEGVASERVAARAFALAMELVAKLCDVE